MSIDPKSKNKNFNTKNIKTYLTEYSNELNSALKHVSESDLEKTRQLLLEIRRESGRVFTAGNGGSAAISEHLGCDWHKGVHLKSKPGLHVHSLVSNVALLTAVANDFGYQKSFSYQLELAQLRKVDVLLLISSSGNSDNIVNAAEYAKAQGCKIIGLTGFTGGKLKNLSDISLHVPFENYGLVEDAHQILMHVIAQFHDLEYSNMHG